MTCVGPGGFFPDRFAPTSPALHTSTREHVFYRIAPAGPYHGMIKIIFNVILTVTSVQLQADEVVPFPFQRMQAKVT